MSQDHLTKPLVKQAEVCQKSGSHGGAVDARIPMKSDCKIVAFRVRGRVGDGARKNPPHVSSGQSLQASR